MYQTHFKILIKLFVFIEVVEPFHCSFHFSHFFLSNLILTPNIKHFFYIYCAVCLILKANHQIWMEAHYLLDLKAHIPALVPLKPLFYNSIICRLDVLMIMMAITKALNPSLNYKNIFLLMFLKFRKRNYFFFLTRHSLATLSYWR